MSTQGIIVILLSVVGFLLCGWVTLYVSNRKDFEEDIEPRVSQLETESERNFKNQQETLELVREIHKKEIINVG